MFASNVLAQPGGMTVLGSPVDLGQVKVDAYITGGTTDHLTPWRGCYALLAAAGRSHDLRAGQHRPYPDADLPAR